MPVVLKLRADPNAALRKHIELLEAAIADIERLSTCDFAEIFEQAEIVVEGDPE